MSRTPDNIRIAGYLAASFLLEREPGEWHALVLIDSNTQAADFVRERTRSHLVLRFDDVEGPRPGRVPPAARQIADALDFARGKDRLLVSCRAGQGRSAALAFLIAYGRDGPEAGAGPAGPDEAPPEPAGRQPRRRTSRPAGRARHVRRLATSVLSHPIVGLH
jgi:hypothetical protein